MLLSLNMLVAGAGAALLCSWRVRGAGFTESLEITHSPSSPSSPSSHLVYFNYTFTHHSPALMELLQLHYPSISHLHLTFTTGRQPLLKQGNGVQLLVIHHDDNANGEEYQHLNWKRLVHDLSGIFCASLNLLDTTVTASPIWSLQHNVNNGGGGGSNSSSSKARYAVLPKESQCTENLTPWIKMLPCRNKAGLAALLDPYHIYNSNFVEMGIQYTKTCGSADCSYLFTQSLEYVVDPVRMGGERSKSWRMSQYHHTSSEIHTCPVATSKSLVVLNIPPSSSITPYSHSYTLTTPPSLGVEGGRAVYTLDELLASGLGGFGVTVASPQIPTVIGAKPKRVDEEKTWPIFSVHRYSTGYGQERGGISLNLINRSDKQVDALVFQVVPWYLELYLSSMTVTAFPVDDTDSDGVQITTTAIKDMFYQPSIPRKRPNVMDAILSIPARTRLDLRISFDKAFIKYTEHPPDANRGFDIGPAIVTIPADGDSSSVFYTSNLLINLATPDFSMPYNVITLSCTVLALLFGSLFNLMMRDVRPVGV